MATFEITAPNGKVYEVSGPDGATAEQALAQVQAQVTKSAEVPQFEKDAKDPAGSMSFGQQMLAGAGKSFMDLGRGAAQLTGLARIPAVRRKLDLDDADVKKSDQALMETGGGATGKIATDIATLAPLSVVPGAASIRGAGAIGATMGAIQPTQGDNPTLERGLNMATGGLVGSGSQFLGRNIGKGLADRAASKADAVRAEQSRNSVRDATLEDAGNAGYVWPPSVVNKPGFVGKSLEGLAGKAALGQEASLRNQQVTNELARKAAGLADDAPISLEALKTVRKDVAQPYRELSELSPEADGVLATLKDARFQATAHAKHYRQSADPAALTKAKDYEGAADVLETRLEDMARQAGRPELVESMRSARTQIAKTYDVERALNEGTGDVEAKILGRAFDKGAKLSGELKTAAKFAEAMPGFTKPGSQGPVQRPGVSQLFNPVIFGAGGYGASGGDPMAALGAASLPLAGGVARKALLSKAVQGRMAQPKYPSTALPPGTPEHYAAIARALALPAVPTLAGE